MFQGAKYKAESFVRGNSVQCQKLLVIEPILGKKFIFIDLVPVILKENLQKDAQMIKYAKIPEITENYRRVLELQELIGVSSTLFIGGKSAQSALTTLPHNVVLKESGSII